MHTYRTRLPQLTGGLFLTDGGIETTMIFKEGFELPYFAAFTLLQDARGTEALRRYFVRHATIARDRGVGFILESATWRASADWGAKLGYTPATLAAANRQAIDLLHDVREDLETPESPMVISGCVGPRGDGYRVDAAMTAAAAAAYHAAQIAVFAERGADLATAITMTYSDEAIGVTRAAAVAGLPVAIAFTVETDGRLPSGESLARAIQRVDDVTGGTPVYYMINCAHPSHFDKELASGAAWVGRIRGVRANASTRSHAELDEAPDLDAGDPVDLGARYRDIRARCPQINVLGGCCGTDERHIEQIGDQCLAIAG